MADEASQRTSITGKEPQHAKTNKENVLLGPFQT